MLEYLTKHKKVLKKSTRAFERVILSEKRNYYHSAVIKLSQRSEQVYSRVAIVRIA